MPNTIFFSWEDSHYIALAALNSLHRPSTHWEFKPASSSRKLRLNTCFQILFKKYNPDFLPRTPRLCFCGFYMCVTSLGLFLPDWLHLHGHYSFVSDGKSCPAPGNFTWTVLVLCDFVVFSRLNVCFLKVQRFESWMPRGMMPGDECWRAD